MLKNDQTNSLEQRYQISAFCEQVSLKRN